VTVKKSTAPAYPEALQAADMQAPRWSPAGDQQLDRLAYVSGADMVNTAARSRFDYDDSVEFSEDWSTGSSWTLDPTVAVSGNKLTAASGANSAGFAGAVRSFALTASQSARIKGSFTLVATGGSGAPTGRVAVGVTSSAAGVLPANYTTFYGIGFDESNVPKAYYGSTVLGTLETSAAYAAGTYEFTIHIDPDNMSVHVTNAAHTVESLWNFARGAHPSPVGTINNVAVITSDSRAASGHKVGPLGVKASTTTLRTRGTIEGNTVSTGYAVFTPSASPLTTRYQLPASYDSRKQYPLVIVSHGVGDDQYTPFTNTTQRTFFDALSAAGYVIASDAFAGINWGAQTAVDKYLLVYRYMRDRFNIGPVVLCGVSMGAMSTLGAIAQRTIPVAGWLGIYPATKLSEAYANTGTGFESQINFAYGITTARLTSAVTAGASSFVCSYPFLTPTQVTVGTGGTAETVTVSTASVSGSGPWTCTITGTFANAHSVSESVLPASPTAYATKTLGHDPLLMDPSRFRGIPMWMSASPSDTTIPKATNADAFNALVSSYSPDVTTFTASGLHGDASHFNTASALGKLATMVNV
jgi:hypothetical protein